RLAAAGQRFVVLGLTALFALLSLAVTLVLGAALFGIPGTPVYPGLACILWALLAPVSAAAVVRCLRQVLGHEPIGAAEEAAARLWLAPLCAFIGSRALALGPADPEDWDSIRFFLRVAALAILLGAALAACTPAARRLELSALILFHFGGICT